MTTAKQKAARIARAKEHVTTDRLNGRFYSDVSDIAGWQPQYDNPHAIIAEHYGTPKWLEHLSDLVFEGLPADKLSWWHVALAEALPVGVDLQPAYHQICVAILTQTPDHREIFPDEYGPQVATAIEQAIAYHSDPSDEKRMAARWMASAWSAVGSSVDSSRPNALTRVVAVAVTAAAMVAAAGAGATEAVVANAERGVYERIANDVIAILKQQSE